VHRYEKALVFDQVGDQHRLSARVGKANNKSN
jgi:hypothetical protein